MINASGAFRPGNVPFGGNKQSGIGRESIVDTVLEMTSEKTVVINNALGPLRDHNDQDGATDSDVRQVAVTS